MAISVGILGATGAVGQRLIQVLDPHPEFEVRTLAASDASAGQPYNQAAKWRAATPIPEAIAPLEVVSTDPEAIPSDVDLLFSSLPSAVASEVEPALAEAGYLISSNSSNERMSEDVPLIIPEINADHLGLLDVQRDERGWDGGLLKNPNCSTITMAPSLAGLRPFGIERVTVATLQAVSGAGYSGVTSMEIIDNVLPYIGGEEAKVETEPTKLLGTFDGARVEPFEVSISASCNRVSTLDGHLENVWVDLEEAPSLEEASAAFGRLASGSLPSSPEPLIHVFDEPDRPQPRLDRERGDGMQITLGGLQTTNEGLQYNVLAHNTLRGAAGASLLNGELLAAEGYL